MASKLKLVLVGLAAGVAALAQTHAWELASPDAKLLLGVDLKSLRASSLGNSLAEQMKAAPPASGIQSPLAGPLQAMAFGLLERIDRIFLSSAAISSPNPGRTKSNPPFLVVVEGKFEMADLKPFLKGPSRKYRGVDVYRTAATNATAAASVSDMAILEGGVLLLGDEKSVLAAIDRRGRALPPASALLARAQSLALTHDLWIIAEGPLSKFQPASTAGGNPLAEQLASQIDGIDFGMSMRDGFQLELSLGTTSDAMATQLAQLVSMQMQAAMQTQSNQPGAAEMMRKLHFGAEGNRVRVSMALTKDEFEQQVRTMQAAQAARAAAGSTAVTITPAPAARPAKPATPGKIIIYGLEGGPREIQTTH